MGKGTLKSLPGGLPLKWRENIVLTRDQKFRQEDVVVCNNKEEVLDYCKYGDAFVIGGEQIYNMLLPHCNKAYVTKVFAKGKGADKFFPNLDDMPFWKLKSQSEVIRDGDTYICFCVYARIW